MSESYGLWCAVCAYVDQKEGVPCKTCKRMTSPEREKRRMALAGLQKHDPYLLALDDFERLLDNAVENSATEGDVQHWDSELRDQINLLREERKNA
jgi:hypothetical protein